MGGPVMRVPNAIPGDWRTFTPQDWRQFGQERRAARLGAGGMGAGAAGGGQDFGPLDPRLGGIMERPGKTGYPFGDAMGRVPAINNLNNPENPENPKPPVTI